jgi:PAS domain S-box-containing protein
MTESKLTIVAANQAVVGEGANSDATRLALANQALRRRAEVVAREKSARVSHSLNDLRDETAGLITPEAMRQKMYELQVHQIELEMQNEELRRTQIELDGARSRYFDLYDLAPVGYCTLSETGLVVEANLTACMMFGVSRHSLISKPISRFIHKSAQDDFYLQRNRLLEQGAAVSFDLQMQKAGGEAFWALLAATVERQPDQSVQLRLVLNDISARRATEAVLQEHQVRYRNLFVAIDEGFCVLDVIFDAAQKAIDYRFIEVNPAFEKQTGLHGVTGKRIRELVPDIEEFWLNLYGNVALTGAPIRMVHESKSMNRWFEVHASIHGVTPGPGVANNSVAVIFNDITERKQAEIRSLQMDRVLHEKNASLQLATAIAEKASRDAAVASQIAETATHVAEKANQAKSAFLSSMSHELRTPLNAILGFAQMLEIGTPPPTLLQKRNVDQILKAGWYLLELINEVLDLSMIESGKVMLSREPVALADLLLECHAMIEPQAQKRGISLYFPQLGRASFVSADRTRFKQVLLNLLLNAIKYNRPNGTVTVECALTSPDILRIGVRDTGAGMAPEQLAHLFQPFNRLGKETGVEEGTGIGLVVTKHLVGLMGGSIGVESVVDVGSLFWVELHVTNAPQFDTPRNTDSPCRPCEKRAICGREELPPGSVCNSDREQYSNPESRSLLYVEDNPANLQLVEQLVAMRTDLRLLSATDGSVGVEFARSLQPDVILMDINLPGISGIQALQILQGDQRTKHIPVIALSANAMASDIEQGLQLGFFHYLTKPIRVRDFMQTLDAALAFAARTAASEHIGKHELDGDFAALLTTKEAP